MLSQKGVPTGSGDGSSAVKNENESLLTEILNGSPIFLASRAGGGSAAVPAKRSESSESITVGDDESGPKKKKKRRVFSCDNCRKLKTKCTYGPDSTACDRCYRLRLDCTLPEPQKKAVTEHSNSVDSRIDRLERLIGGLGDRMESLVDGMEKKERERELERERDERTGLGPATISFHAPAPTGAAGPHPNGDLGPAVTDANGNGNGNGVLASAGISVGRQESAIPHTDSLAPLNIIGQIQSKFGEPQRDVFRETCNEFIKFSRENEKLCFQLAKNFLETAHFWIIPGGISEIDRDYIVSHPFITCVYVLMAIRFNSGHDAERKALIPIASRLVTAASLSVPLSDHDIEAILYMCLYNFSKGSHDLDTWILSSVGREHCVASLDLGGISNRVQCGIFTEDDLFHLRIFNGLCCSHYQNAIGYGRSPFIDPAYRRLHQATIEFPMATVGDAIKISEIELYELLSIALTSGTPCRAAEDQLKFANFNDWYERWGRIIPKDVSQTLTFAYHFAYVMLARKVIQKEHAGPETTSSVLVPLAYNTACQHSFEILNRMLALQASIIKGTPSFQLNQIVFACVTLFDYLDAMKPQDRKTSLNLISKVYWYLNQSGEGHNMATTTIARIVRKLVELANNHQSFKYEKRGGFIGTGSITTAYERKRHMKRRDSQQQRRLAPEDLPLKERHRRSSSMSLSPVYRVRSPHRLSAVRDSPSTPNSQGSQDSQDSQDGNFELPDVANFKSFEDFYYDIFSTMPQAP